jgi:hypothetical protein
MLEMATMCPKWELHGNAEVFIVSAISDEMKQQAIVNNV